MWGHWGCRWFKCCSAGTTRTTCQHCFFFTFDSANLQCVWHLNYPITGQAATPSFQLNCPTCLNYHFSANKMTPHSSLLNPPNPPSSNHASTVFFLSTQQEPWTQHDFLPHLVHHHLVHIYRVFSFSLLTSEPDYAKQSSRFQIQPQKGNQYNSPRPSVCHWFSIMQGHAFTFSLCSFGSLPWIWHSTTSVWWWQSRFCSYSKLQQPRSTGNQWVLSDLPLQLLTCWFFWTRHQWSRNAIILCRCQHGHNTVPTTCWPTHLER